MKLVLVTGRFPERSETFIYRKAVGLARRGHDVTMLVRSIGDWSLYDAPPSSLRVVQVPPDLSRRDPRQTLRSIVGALGIAIRAPRKARAVVELASRGDDAARTIARHLPLVELDADVVHFEFLGGALMYPKMREIVGAPTVVSCRGQDVHRFPILDEAERSNHIAALQRVDAVHCVSSELAATVTRWTGRSERVFVNRPAVDVMSIPAPLRARRSPVRIVASGRLTWIKGFDYLLAALQRLVHRGIDFHAEIIGAGELAKPLRFSIEDMGLTAHVTLVGGVSSNEALQRVQAADIFVLSSHNEGISNAVLEAMAAGLPIVTTRSGGMTEAVADGIEGFVVPVRDVGSLANRIERLCRDAALRERMGRAARERAATDFTIERQLDVFEAVYASLASAR